MAASPPEPLLSVSQAARLLGVHANTIRSWTDAGRLTAYRINERGDRRYRRSDVISLLVEEHLPTAAAPGTPVAQGEDGELAIFSRIAAELSASTLPSGVANAAVQGLRGHLAIEHAAVYAVDTDDAVLELGARAGFAGLELTVPADDPRGWPSGPGMAVLPLRAGTSVVGLLILGSAAADSMSEPLQRSLTSSIASHLANARLLVRSRLEVRRARALRAVTKELTENLDLSRVVADIVERTRTMFGADRAGIWLFDG
ncbi:MAG: helix-turn-helix domain-containing protein, partial [Candidatus Limnocylindria bacterium]